MSPGGRSAHPERFHGRRRADQDAVRDALSDETIPSDAEMERRILEYDRASEFTGPIGSFAAAIVFILVVGDAVPGGRLAIWSAVMMASVVGMLAGAVLRRRAWLGIPSFALTGLTWGSLPLVLSVDGMIAERWLWTSLAFLFATTAGVLSGTNVDVRPGRAVVLTMWGTASVALVVVDRPALALAGIVFVVIVDRDLRNTSTMVAELIELRSSAADRARDAARAALRDPMTGVLNRSGLEHELHRDGRDGRFGAVFFVDLDRFKDVNDLHGHQGGDQVLMAAAGRLRGIVRDEDLVARVGGDEFVIVLHDAHDRSVLLERAAQVIEVLEEPVALEGSVALCSASVGIAAVPDGEIDLDQLLSESDHAMYAAKRGGRRRAVMYGEEQRAAFDDHAELANALRRAVRDGSIDVWGQPIVVTADRSVFGIELLARWPAADGSWIAPSRFIPVAEAIGVSGDIARMVLGRAIGALVDWNGHPVLGAARVGLNVSGIDLRGGWLADEIRRRVASAGVHPGRLVVEITESETLHDDPETRRCLAELHELGVRVALDDFGTGYSSITSLLELSIDVVKLDRSLTLAAAGPVRGRRDVIAAIAALAGTIGRYVLAEGVETEDEAAAVAALGFQFAQGHLYCPPLPLDALASRTDLVAMSSTSMPAGPRDSTVSSVPQ